MARKKTVEPATEESRAMEQRVVAFAEQLGRMVGTVERKTTGWLDMTALNDQLTRIRDGAADLLSHIGATDATRSGQPVEGDDSSSASLAPSAASGTGVEGKPATRRRKSASPRPAAVGGQRVRAPRAATSRVASGSDGSREHVAAPGKTHRKPPTTVAGAKHSNEEIAKAGAAARNRRTRGR